MVMTVTIVRIKWITIFRNIPNDDAPAFTINEQLRQSCDCYLRFETYYCYTILLFQL
jgi:hypothetical protein